MTLFSAKAGDLVMAATTTDHKQYDSIAKRFYPYEIISML